jgi:uncharacterized protein (TIGR02996 family)
MTVSPVCHPELKVLLSEVKALPDDDTPRLILADWLQDHGDPRGEFIHLQVVRHHLADDDPRRVEMYQRECQILRRHSFDWLGPLADHAGSWTFTRGFIALLARAERFLNRAVFDLAAECDVFAWVEELALSNVGLSELVLLAGSPLLPHLVRLDLSHNDVRDGGLIRLLEAPDLRRLHTLRLEYNRISQRGARMLALCNKLAGLRVLDLCRNRLNDAAAVALAQSPHLRNLERLEMAHNRLTLAGQDALREAFGERVVLRRPRSEVD